MGRIQTDLFNLAEKYRLEPITYCLFDKAFRNLQQNKFKQFLNIRHQNIEFPAVNPEDSLDQFYRLLTLSDVNALICLRLVIKFAET
jgi:hypothetical protein